MVQSGELYGTRSSRESFTFDHFKHHNKAESGDQNQLYVLLLHTSDSIISHSGERWVHPAVPCYRQILWWPYLAFHHQLYQQHSQSPVGVYQQYCTELQGIQSHVSLIYKT